MWIGIVLYHWCWYNIIWIVGVVTVKDSTAWADGMKKSKPYGRTAVVLRWWQVGH